MTRSRLWEKSGGRIALGCAGPQGITDHLKRQGFKMPPSNLVLYHILEIYRNDLQLWTLESIKKAFLYWREEKDLESMHTLVWFHYRRPEKNLPKGLVYKKNSLIVET